MKINIDEILKKVNILDVVRDFVSLKKSGLNSYKGVCPFHEEKTPSFSLNVHKQIFKCFGCGVGGNVIEFVKKYQNVSFGEGIKYLNERYDLGLELSNVSNIKHNSEPKSKALEILDKTNSYFIFQFEVLPLEHNVRTYFKNRKINFDILRKFNIGYAPENGFPDTFVNHYGKEEFFKVGLLNEHSFPYFWNRMTIAIKNQYGEIVGFAGRRLDENNEIPKYINSPETELFQKHKLLFNIDNALETMNKTNKVIMVEGFFDVIAVDRIGYHNVVGTMGTALTKDQLSLLKNKEIMLFFDNDAAGLNATKKNLHTILENAEQLNLKVSIIDNKYSKDADEILNNEVDGEEKLKEVLNSKLDVSEWLMKEYFEKVNNDLSIDDTHCLLVEAFSYIYRLPISKQLLIKDRLSNKLILSNETFDYWNNNFQQIKTRKENKEIKNDTFLFSKEDLVEKQNKEGKKYYLGNLSKNEKILIPHSFVKQKEEYGVITCPNNFEFKVLTNVLNNETNEWEHKTKMMTSFEIRKKLAKQKQLSEPQTFDWTQTKKLKM